MFAFVFFSPRQKFPSGWNGPNNNTKIWLFLVVRAEEIHHQQLIQTELLRCIHSFQEIRSVSNTGGNDRERHLISVLRAK